MEFAVINSCRSGPWPRQLRTLPVLVLLALGTTVFAQNIQLSPAQQQMLNQLPPAQRQQALQALEQLNGQSSTNTRQSSIVEDLSPLPQSPLPTDFSQSLEEPQAEGGSRLIINLTAREILSRQETALLENDAALQRILGSHYYELDESGVLVLPGLPSIPLLGLTSKAIEQRLGAEPSLKIFGVGVNILDTKSIGTDALEPFGYGVFESTLTGFEPVTSGPVPPDYVLGPGDSIRVQLYGNVNGIYEFEVTRDGILNLPELGPVTVAGLPFSEFRADLDRRVQEMLIGTQVSVTMGQLRSIRVFVLGDVNRPGSYVVSGLGTISSALYRSGGISDIGSMRNIQLKRKGQLVARLDVYDLLLNGDTSGDSRLQPGDVIFVPPIGAQVSVGGAVKRPAMYEMRGPTSVADVVALAGGLVPEAYPNGARIEHINSQKERVVITVDASSTDGRAMSVSGGDTLIIPKVLQELNNSVLLAGHVQRPGPYQWREGMRLAGLIPSALDLVAGADADYVLIRREDPLTRQVQVVSASLSHAWSDSSSSHNILLQARDTVYVFSLAFGRQRVISPILEELKLQSRFGEPYKDVGIVGQVKAQGTYPLEPGMRVSDLLRAGGNLSEQAYTLGAELTRYSIINGDIRATEVINVDLDAILQGVEFADLLLAEHDYLRISTVPEWDSEWSVTLEGEVRFPGEYRIRRGETLQQLLERAGSLTEAAFPEGAIFLRESLRLREQEQIDVLADRMQADLASLSLEAANTNGGDTLSTGSALLNQLRASEASGRLVIDLDIDSTNGSATGAAGNMELRDKDRLLIPTQSQVVTVIGETQQNTSHLFEAGLSRNGYIEKSGGLTRRADKKLIYVVRASGAVIVGKRSKWFGRGSGAEIRPGDTIVVPLEIDKIRPLAFWGSVTQILYQGAIAVAAITTFNN